MGILKYFFPLFQIQCYFKMNQMKFQVIFHLPDNLVHTNTYYLNLSLNHCIQSMMKMNQLLIYFHQNLYVEILHLPFLYLLKDPVIGLGL